MTDRYRVWRRAAGIIEAAVMLGLPFVKINGESAFRFDIPSLRLHFFGTSIWMEDFFIVLVATVFLSLLVIMITTLFGRVWCGWACPQAVISDFTGFIESAASKGPLSRLLAHSVLFFISIVIAADLIWYFVPPGEFFIRLINGNPGHVTIWIWSVMTVILFLNFAFLRQRFCATACPYAKLQGTLFDDKTLLVAFDPRGKKECVECGACVRACPVGIDIRDGTSSACIHCAQCVDACSAVMRNRNRPSLINYFFGIPGTKRRNWRPGAFVSGTAASAFFGLFLYLVISYVPLQIVALPDYSLPPRITRDGSAVNSYTIVVRNKGRNDLSLKLSARAGGRELKIRPENLIYLQAGESGNIKLYVAMTGRAAGSGTTLITISAMPQDSGLPSVSTEASFVYPGETR